MKLGIVTPRYGREVAGGAETAARLLAERLAGRPGWSVEVLTSCALDADTWVDHYEPGRVEEDGVVVRRFPVVGQRAADFDRASEPILSAPRHASARDQEDWLVAQGPVVPALDDAIHRTDADVVAVHPYLYHPTLTAVRALRGRAVLHPAAHDERPLHLPVFREVFAAAGALVYWSEAERRLVEARFPVAGHPSIVLGLGVDPAPGGPQPARDALGLAGRPYVLCLGRVDDGKGSRLLFDLFTAYKARRPGPLTLVFAGPVVHPLPTHPDVLTAGTVPEAVKWGLLRGAHLLVSPSAFESFSIVLLEAWAVGSAAIVNARCAVTREHVARSGGGLAVGSYAELEVALDRLLPDDALRSGLGAAGRAYVEAHYRWDVLLERYASFLTRAAGRARAGRHGG